MLNDKQFFSYQHYFQNEDYISCLVTITSNLCQNNSSSEFFICIISFNTILGPPAKLNKESNGKYFVGNTLNYREKQTCYVFDGGSNIYAA